MSEEQLYDCATPGCVNKRTKAQGGTIFTVCDTCWDETHKNFSDEKPDHLKVCAEKDVFECGACGKECCFSHGIPVGPHPEGKQRAVKTIGMKRCTFCADSGR